MAKPSYYELLKHPKWQEKRLRIMERDGFTCQHCQDKETTLSVHHGYYEKGKMPWEYPDGSLTTLCDTCHKNAEGLRLAILHQLAEVSNEDAQQVLGFICGMRVAEGSKETFRAETCHVLRGALRAIESSYVETAQLAFDNFDKTKTLQREELISLATPGSEPDTLTPDETLFFHLILAVPSLARDAIGACWFGRFPSSTGTDLLLAYRKACETPSFDPLDYKAVKSVASEGVADTLALLFQEAMFCRRKLSTDAVDKVGDVLEKLASRIMGHETVVFDPWAACTG